MRAGIHPLKSIVESQKEGAAKGICSICSSNMYVIEAAMQKALKDDTYVLIEATANQVNQYGGYTGMRPVNFRKFVFDIAEKVGIPYSKVILGGDHLGPLVWKNEPAEEAMKKAGELVRQYVLAGFSKIHLDTSMRLGGEPEDRGLETSLIAERSAMLCAAAEEAYKELSGVNTDALAPVYVIGSEVPIPGGSREKEDNLEVTKVEDLNTTIEEFEKVFKKHGLNSAWHNVIAVVVQPGVEFSDDSIHEYSHEKAKELCNCIKKRPWLVFEGHSTDYQTAERLKEMVQDGIAILKVGPALTFAVREALFSLQCIENELFIGEQGICLSRFREIIDEAMVKNPEHWQKYYNGDENKLNFSRKYSMSDRIRYYLTVPEVKNSICTLVNNLKHITIPIALISQFFPIQYCKIRNGILRNDPEEIIKDKVVNVLNDYSYATGK